MGYQVILAPRAVRDLEAIVRYIALDNPSAALRFGQALVEKAESVGAFPEAGRVVPEIGNPDIREVRCGSYRIVYHVNHSRRAVEIARFWHAAQGQPRP
jgi:plasmid stabilization system protein ParE